MNRSQRRSLIIAPLLTGPAPIVIATHTNGGLAMTANGVTTPGAGERCGAPNLTTTGRDIRSAAGTPQWNAGNATVKNPETGRYCFRDAWTVTPTSTTAPSQTEKEEPSAGSATWSRDSARPGSPNPTTT